jgi:hypothetical protein
MPAEDGVLRTVARLAPWLAPLPSAWFIGRSIYLHLLVNWPIPLPIAVNLAVATVAGLVVELLAIVSVHNSLALFRWNDQGHVKREHGWEHAPFGLSVACASAYVLAAAVLLILLEAMPEAAQYAPMMFPLLTVVGAVNLGILDQHLSRLRRYRLTWDLTAEHHGESAELPPVITEQTEPPPKQPATRLTFAAFAAKHPDGAALTTAEIAAIAGISERQARNWRHKMAKSPDGVGK